MKYIRTERAERENTEKNEKTWVQIVDFANILWTMDTGS